MHVLERDSLSIWDTVTPLWILNRFHGSRASLSYTNISAVIPAEQSVLSVLYKGIKHISPISVVKKGFLDSHIKTEIVKDLMEDMEGIDRRVWQKNGHSAEFFSFSVIC